MGDERSEEEVCVGNAVGVGESDAVGVEESEALSWAAQDSLVSPHSPLNRALMEP